MFSPEDFVTRDVNDDYNNSEDIEDDDISDSSMRGKTILHILANNCDEYFVPAEIIELLCSHGANTNALNFASLTPAALLAKNHKDSGHALECLYAFIRAGVRDRAFLELV